MTEATQAPPVTGSAEVYTFLIADIRGYTRFTREHGDQAAAQLVTRFARIAGDAVAHSGGRLVELRGDEAMAVFASPRDAMRAAIDMQTRFAAERSAGLPIPVGIGLDAGEAVPVGDGFRGSALNLASRLSGLAAEGEVLASDTVSRLGGAVEGLVAMDRGPVDLKGFADPVRVMQIVPRRDVVLSDSSCASSQPLPIGGFLGALPAGPLVARAAEAEEIRATVDSVAAGQGRLLLIAGEAGAGKTRLAQEVTLRARNGGFAVGAGSCFEARQGVPYYPFLDALTMILADSPAELRAVVPQRWPYLAALLRLGGMSTPPTASSEEEQERLLRTVASFVQAVAERRPVAILIDDLHWADAASLALFAHLASHQRAYPVLLVGTYRDEEIGRHHPLEGMLLDLNRQGLTQRLLVRGLAPEGTAELISATFDQEKISAAFVDIIHRHTEGNPFFIQEVLRALVERGDVYRVDGRWERRELDEIEVPESVRAVIGQRLSRLEEPVQDALRHAAVLGQSFRFDDLQRMGGYEEYALEGMLDRAREIGIITEARLEIYNFNHTVIHQVLYAELSGRRKRRLHFAAMSALEQLPEHTRDERVAELAWHALEADAPERALQYALLAGERAERTAARAQAERQYRVAVELAREHGDRATLATALANLARAMVRPETLDAVQPIVREAAELFEQLGNTVMEARALCFIAHTAADKGEARRSANLYQRAEQLLQAVPAETVSADFARAWMDLADYYFHSGRYAAQLAADDRAVEIARRLGKPDVLLDTEAARLLPIAMLRSYPEVRREAEAIIPRAESLGQFSALLKALYHAAEATTLSGELDQSRQYRERALALETRLQDRWAGTFTLSNLSWLARIRGDWPEAERLGQESINNAENSVRIALYGLVELGTLRLQQGRQDEGTALLEQALEAARTFGDLQFLRLGEGSLAQQDLLDGHPRAVVERLEPLLDRPGLREHNVTQILPILAIAHLDLGQADQAENLAAEAVERAEEQENRLALVDALHALGAVLAAKGQLEEADASLDRGIALAHAMPYPYAEGRLLARRAQLLVGRDPAQAEELMRQALALFRRLGAEAEVTRADQFLRTVTAGS